MTKKYKQKSKQKFRKTKHKRGGAGFDLFDLDFGPTYDIGGKIIPFLQNTERGTVIQTDNPNITNWNGSTALILAADKGGDYAEVVKKLLTDDRVDPNIDNNNSNTALILATKKGHDSVVELLLANKRVDPNLVDENGDTALIIATKKGHDLVVKLLLNNSKTDPNISNRQGETALMRAAYAGDVPVVELLLADQRVDPNIADRQGNIEWTALAWAANEKKSDVLELLLEDHRTTRTRPPDNLPDNQPVYDLALFNVKYRRHARFKGLVRAAMAFRYMRLRAAEKVYAPGGKGYMAAAASFGNKSNTRKRKHDGKGTKEKKRKKKKKVKKSEKGTKRQGSRPKRKKRR